MRVVPRCRSGLRGPRIASLRDLGHRQTVVQADDEATERASPEGNYESLVKRNINEETCRRRFLASTVGNDRNGRSLPESRPTTMSAATLVG